jgi:hypothetical protein
LAIRITVVVIQAAHRDGRMSDYEEQLLTRVMLENSLDAVFVGPLEQMTPDGTDALCLSKIPANSVVLGWLPLGDAAAHFERLGLPWCIQQSQPTERLEVQYRQIRTEQPIDELMSRLLQILKNVSIKTLQIALPGSASRAAKPAPIVSAQPRNSGNSTERQPAGPRSTQPMRAFTQMVKSADSERDELDQLVDDLESLDL